MTNEELEREIAHLATKEDLANLRAEVHKALADQLKWTIGLLIAQTGILIAILHK